MRPLGSAFLGHPTIEPRERELIILRTCARCGAEYEWGVHVMAFAAAVGLDPDLVTATASAGPERVSADERDMLLFRLVDELHDTSSVSDALWGELSTHWSASQLLEMIALVGFYHLISFIVNATRVESESWAARFP
jgi:alkylhydroperoxidase family enzyme